MRPYSAPAFFSELAGNADKGKARGIPVYLTCLLHFSSELLQNRVIGLFSKSKKIKT